MEIGCLKMKKDFTDKEYLDCVQDILDSAVFQSTDQFIQHGTTTCMEHCIQVSYLSYCICRKKGLDYKRAARAGLLHDLFLYDWHTHARETGNHFHGFTHPRLAAHNAEKYFKISREEKMMIARHMWPLTLVPPMSREGMVLTYADKVCSASEVVARVKNWLPALVGNHHIV